MKRFTVSVSEEFKKRLEEYPDINWPEVMKEGMRKRLVILEKMHSRGVL